MDRAIPNVDRQSFVVDETIALAPMPSYLTKSMKKDIGRSRFRSGLQVRLAQFKRIRKQASGGTKDLMSTTVLARAKNPGSADGCSTSDKWIKGDVPDE